jgi:hypothetical protein
MLLKPLASYQAYAEQFYADHKYFLATCLIMVKQVIEMTIYLCECSILNRLQQLELGEGIVRERNACLPPSQLHPPTNVLTLLNGAGEENRFRRISPPLLDTVIQLEQDGWALSTNASKADRVAATTRTRTSKVAETYQLYVMETGERRIAVWNGHPSQNKPKLFKVKLITDLRPPWLDRLV